MKKNISAVVLAVALLGAPQAYANTGKPESVQDFLAACKNDSVYILYCIGLIEGLGVVLKLNGQGSSKPKYRTCAPPNVTQGQKIAAFEKWAADHPAKWQLPGEVGMILAMIITWPCK
jgi:hypothetical protein